MVPAFGHLLGAQLTARGLSTRAAARLLDCSHAFVHQVVRGESLPPMARLEHWLDALEVAADEREQWREAAALAHAPESVRERYRAQQAELVRLQRRVAELEGGSYRA